MVDYSAVSSYAYNIIQVVIGIFAIVFFGAMLWAGIHFGKIYMKFSKFKVVIWEDDGFGQKRETYDKAGIFVDSKTGNKRLFLKKCNVGLNADKVPYIPSGKVKTIYLLRTGLKNFHFIRMNVKDPDVTLSVGEEDVNWALNDYERQKKRFAHKDLLQYLPFIGLAFVSLIILILFWQFFKKFDVLADLARSLNEAAQALAQAQAGTTVV